VQPISTIKIKTELRENITISMSSDHWSARWCKKFSCTYQIKIKIYVILSITNIMKG